MERVMDNWIEQYLIAIETVRQTLNPPHREGYIYQSYEALLLDKGRSFPVPERARPVGMRKGRQGFCYANSFRLVWTDPTRYIYCEGKAAGVIPVTHAWVWDREEACVIETTWKEPAECYYGLALEFGWASSQIGQSKTWGILENDWLIGRPMLKEGVVTVEL